MESYQISRNQKYSAEMVANTYQASRITAKASAGGPGHQTVLSSSSETKNSKRFPMESTGYPEAADIC